MEPLELAREVVNAVEDKKAEQIVLLDLRPDSIVADYFVICSAGSIRQLRAVADNVREMIKLHFDRPPYSVEGDGESGWILMDYGDVVVHIMSGEQRDYYDLEGLWNEANIVVSIQ